MNEEQRNKIIKALTQRVSDFVCPFCHQAKYTFIEAYSVEPVQNDYKGLQIGSKMLPSVMLVCGNCGHVDKFSLGVLGLMEGESKHPQDKDK